MSSMDKHYHEDWAKSRSRDLVREMIASTLLAYRKPEDLRVLCFPGIDAQEVIEVYDPLGIPRGNVTGIERDAAIADAIRAKGLGITVHTTSIEDFVEQERRLPYDVVSLDYVSPISAQGLQDIGRICAKQPLNRFVLHIANLLKRERDMHGTLAYALAQKDYLPTTPLEETPREAALHPTATSVARSELWAQTLQRAKDGESLAEAKRAAFSMMVRAKTLGGSKRMIDQVYGFAMGSNAAKLTQALDERLSSFFRQEISLDPLHPMEHPCSTHPYAQSLIEEYTLMGLRYELERCGFPADHATTFALSSALGTLAKDTRWFETLRSSPYTYISESGSPMIGDLRFLSHPLHVLERAQEVAHLVNYPREFKAKGTGYEFARAIHRFVNERQKHCPSAMIREVHEADKEPVFLGNSARPALSKKRAIEEFKAGASVEDLQSKYRGWARMPLAQWKAHVTMGTYDNVRTIDDLASDQAIERISKTDAVDLLATGIPAEEIAAVYQGSFTLGQLRAFKAHLTMGRYANGTPDNR